MAVENAAFASERGKTHTRTHRKEREPATHTHTHTHTHLVTEGAPVLPPAAETIIYGNGRRERRVRLIRLAHPLKEAPLQGEELGLLFSAKVAQVGGVDDIETGAEVLGQLVVAFRLFKQLQERVCVRVFVCACVSEEKCICGY